MVSLKNITNSAAAAHYYEQDNYYTSGEESRERSVWWGKYRRECKEPFPLTQRTANYITL